MIEFLSQPWPWWVAGPLIGLTVPLLLWAGGEFGVSENLRHMCAAALPTKNEFFQYDWKSKGGWNLVFVLGIIIGGCIAGTALASPDPVIAISDQTTADLQAIGIQQSEGLAPAQIFSWAGLATVPGFIMIVVGNFTDSEGRPIKSGS